MSKKPSSRGGQNPQIDVTAELASGLHISEGSRSKGNSGYQIPSASSHAERVKQSGQSGSSIEVYANHYPMVIKSKDVYHYDVQFKCPWSREIRKSDKPLLIRTIEQFKIEAKNILKVEPNCIVYDGQHAIYTCSQLAIKDKFSHEISIKEEPDADRVISLTVTIQQVDKIPVTDEIYQYCSGGLMTYKTREKVSQVLNVVLGMTAQLKHETIGRNIFNLNSKGSVFDLEDSAKSLWVGTFLSVRLGWKPMINVDMANKPAYKEGPVTEFVKTICSNRQRRVEAKDAFKQRGNYEKIDMELKGLKIRVKRPDGAIRDYRVIKLMAPANELKVDIEGTKMTVEKFFLQTYKYKLREPSLPCIHVGNPKNTVYIPMELCSLKRQPCPSSKKLGEKETASMIKHTAVPPLDRKKHIDMGLQNMNNFFAGDPYANAFGVSIDKNMALIKARVLQAPKLAYDDTGTTDPKDGKWSMDRNRLAFKKGMSLVNWGLLNCSKVNDDAVYKFLDVLTREGQKCKFKVDEPSYLLGDSFNIDKIVVAFKNLYEMIKREGRCEKPKLIMIFVDGKGPSYAALKHLGDVEFAIPTQFVLAKNVSPFARPNQPPGPSPQTIHNICLKLNAKLGGTNQTLSKNVRPPMMARPIMIIGGDVTHPSPDQMGSKPSIAAVVGSTDPNASLYNVEVRIQYGGQAEEVIKDTEAIIKNLLLKFYNANNGRKPEKLVYYRDGVSEGQFQTVLDKELSAIRRACVSLEADYKPPILFLVAQKRHKTRLFLKNPSLGVGRNKNVPPGTCVDTDITHPTEYDFFLASHEGIQGTTKPTHYHLLWDDMNMSMDAIQQLTYYLCHLYSRCERSVSYPAPTYYAHLAAFRAREHHNRLLDKGLGSNAVECKKIENMQFPNYFI